MPERLAALVFHAPGVNIKARAQAKRGLEAAAQIFPAGNGQIAALNRASLSRTVKAAINAAINQAVDADMGLSCSGQRGQESSETTDRQPMTTTHAAEIPLQKQMTLLYGTQAIERAGGEGGRQVPNDNGCKCSRILDVQQPMQGGAMRSKACPASGQA